MDLGVTPHLYAVSVIFWWSIVVTCSNLLIFFFFCYLRWPNSNWDGCLLNYRDQREVEQMSSHSIYICMLHRVSMSKVSSTLHLGQPISDTCNFWSFWSQVSWGSECAVLCNFWCAPCCMLQRLILCVMMFAAFCCDHRHELWVCGHKWSAPPRGDLGWQEEIWASWTWRGWRWNERACRDLSSSFSVQSAWVHLHTSGWELHNPVSISNTCNPILEIKYSAFLLQMLRWFYF